MTWWRRWAISVAAILCAAAAAAPVALAGPAEAPVQQTAPRGTGIRLGKTPTAAPKPSNTPVVIESVEPRSADAGQAVTITFSPAREPPVANMAVLFSDADAKIVGRAPGSLSVIVPAPSAAGLAKGQPVPISLQGQFYTQRPFSGFAYTVAPSPAEAAPRTKAELQQARYGELEAAAKAQSDRNTLIAVMVGAAVLIAIGAAMFRLQHLRQQALMRDLERTRERLDEAMAPVAASPSDWGEEPAEPDDDGPMSWEDGPSRVEAPLPPPTPPEELVRAVSAGGAILFAGSGISAQAGLPTWTRFIDDFLANLEATEPDGDWGSVRAQLARRAILVVADLIEHRGKGKALAKAIHDTYGVDAPPPAWLRRMFNATPFAGVLTTNFDSVTETAAADCKPLVLGMTSKVDYGALLRENRFFVLRLHGDPMESPAAAFAVEHLPRALEDKPDLRGFLATLFTSRPMLFVGMNADTIDGFFTALGARSSSVRHFALLPEQPDSAVVAERFAARYNLQVLTFRPTQGYPEIQQFLDRLAQDVAALQRAEPAPDDAAKSRVAPMRVSKVRIVNIGPFEDATFDFSAGWTVLLGDNGCGKSTVLRAVALALCGSDDEATRHAQSLLRKDPSVSTGSIELTIASDPPTTYTVDLAKGREGVTVRASGYGPLQAGAMVAFGFPALRGVIAGLVPPPSTDGMNYPRVQDVSALIRGGIDARVSNLRGWIRDNYVRSQDTKLGEARHRYGAMLTKLFELIDGMIPGFDVRLSRYDTVTGEVLLKTPDGELPMDYVSQGMSSTIGWLGVLVQRLYEIYPRTDAPEREHALLLVDEMDSHLHPEWQRVLAPNIKKHFPNLQVIATTHSPLVVANMEAGEVIRVVRDGGEVEIQHIQQSFSGYRADQVLTAEAFGLSSTRSVAWEEKRAEYAALLGNSNRSKTEQERMDELARELEEDSARGRTPAQAAATVVQAALEKKAANLDWGDASKQRTLDEASEYLAKITAAAPAAPGAAEAPGPNGQPPSRSTAS